MSKEIKFSSGQSRNTHDWNYRVDESGRHSLEANGKGVKRRLGLLVTRLARSPQSARQLLLSLQKTNPTYNLSDIRQGLKRLVDAGLAGKSHGHAYALTSAGAAKWMLLDKQFT